jgi:hypothetical protein
MPVPVTLGITDGTSTEIVRGELTEGQAVLIGLEAESTGTPSVGGPGLRF